MELSNALVEKGADTVEAEAAAGELVASVRE
jgi:hypothetical protein